MLTGWTPPDVDRFIERQYPDYWLKIETRKQADHARLIRRAEAAAEKLATSFTSDSTKIDSTAWSRLNSRP